MTVFYRILALVIIFGVTANALVFYRELRDAARRLGRVLRGVSMLVHFYCRTLFGR